MSVRETSVETFRQIEREGLLTGVRLQVYKTIFDNGPMTMAEARKLLHPLESKTVSPRFSELSRMAAIYEVNERFCAVTGRRAIAWDVTKNLPLKLDKKKTNAQKVILYRELICKIQDWFIQHRPKDAERLAIKIAEIEGE